MMSKIRFKIVFTDSSLTIKEIGKELSYLREDILDLDGLKKTHFESLRAVYIDRLEVSEKILEEEIMDDLIESMNYLSVSLDSISERNNTLNLGDGENIYDIPFVGNQIRIQSFDWKNEVDVGLSFEVYPKYLNSVFDRLSKRLEYQSIETLFITQIEQVHLQVKTSQFEELESFKDAVTALLPPDSHYLTKVGQYIMMSGDFSAAQEAILELIRLEFNLPVEKSRKLRQQVLGLYETLADKIQYFREILSLEINMETFSDEGRWSSLSLLAEDLDLPQDTVNDLFQKHRTKIKNDIDRLQLEQDLENRAKIKQEENRRSIELEVQEERLFLNRKSKYSEMLRQAILSRFYPTELDQGRLEQARYLWKISGDIAIQIEESVRSELYGAIPSAMGADYSRLRYLLWSQLWQEADQETENVLLKALHPKTLEPLDRDTILQLPCVDLMTIDHLWSRYSNGRFGFKAQQQIYLQVERRPADFLPALGWRGAALSLTWGLKP